MSGTLVMQEVPRILGFAHGRVARSEKSGGEDASDCGKLNEQFVLLGATTQRGNILGFRSDQVGRILLVGDGSKRKHEDGRRQDSTCQDWAAVRLAASSC